MTKKKQIAGQTKSGFNFAINPEMLENYELIEILADIDENPLLFPKLLNMLLGKEQKERLIEHIRTKSGIVPIESLKDEIGEIFLTSGELKNSPSSAE